MNYTFHIPLLFVGIAVPVLASAQTLTASNALPGVGHTEEHTPFLQEGATWSTVGTGITWDATNATQSGDQVIYTFRSPFDSQVAASFPEATIAVESSAGPWNYYLGSWEGLWHLGSSVGADAAVWLESERLCMFPWEYGTAFSDINNSGWAYFASGQVATPWGVIPDVVMISSFENNSPFHDYMLYRIDNMVVPIGRYYDWPPRVVIDQVDVTTGLDAETLNGQVSVYPNPTSGLVNVKIAGALPNGNAIIEVRDMLGRVVTAQRATNGLQQLDLTGWPHGLYTVQMYNGTQVTKHRITLQ